MKVVKRLYQSYHIFQTRFSVKNVSMCPSNVVFSWSHHKEKKKEKVSSTMNVSPRCQIRLLTTNEMRDGWLFYSRSKWWSVCVTEYSIESGCRTSSCTEWGAADEFRTARSSSHAEGRNHNDESTCCSTCRGVILLRRRRDDPSDRKSRTVSYREGRPRKQSRLVYRHVGRGVGWWEWVDCSSARCPEGRPGWH